MKKRLLVLYAAVAVIASLAFASQVQASTPIQFRFTKPVVFTDTDTCGFPIDVNLQATVVGRAFVDDQGNIERLIIEQSVVGTDTANGITLRDATHYVDVIDSLGGVKEVGLDFHVQDGGLVLRNAGYILFNPDGSVAFVAGPHPFPTGDIAPFCAALTP